ncbi:ABC transporter permease [Actinoplanes oblitus]|uniref:ABC transporter permease n=1 Tax=Actinoplanes oblitus TaxID=3040509 RepID=A0ABY8WEW1_9ACTN|nr:ABC transporter permease [Actinoplanes oblitus]WIM96399.1 ABC transporter permease [Actinoplanes oblitus]
MNTDTAVRPDLSHLFAAEWLKVRTLRSFRACALAAVILAVGGAALAGAAYTDSAFAEGLTARDAATDVFSWATAVLQIPVLVLGVLVLGSEFSGGAIRVTFVAVPRRLRVIAAKALVVAAASALLATVSLGLGYAAAVPLLSRAKLADVPFGTVLSLLAGQIGYCVLVGLFAYAVTLLVRNTAAGVGLTLGVLLLLRLVLAVLDIWVRFDLTGLAFSAAASQVVTDPFSRALPVVVAWLAVPATLGALALVRRDA